MPGIGGAEAQRQRARTRVPRVGRQERSCRRPALLAAAIRCSGRCGRRPPATPARQSGSDREVGADHEAADAALQLGGVAVAVDIAPGAMDPGPHRRPAGRRAAAWRRRPRRRDAGRLRPALSAKAARRRSLIASRAKWLSSSKRRFSGWRGFRRTGCRRRRARHAGRSSVRWRRARTGRQGWLSAPLAARALVARFRAMSA